MTQARTNSPWLDRDVPPADASVAAASSARRLGSTTIRAVSYDVLVVGAGVVGCTAALEAARRGMSVALIDAERDAARGVSGQATVKVTSGPGLRAASIASLHGDGAAIEYLQACEAGVAFVRRHAVQVEHVDHEVYASDADDVLALERSASLATAAGVDVRRMDGDLPFTALDAVSYPGTLLIDPVTYVRGLLVEATALGVDVGFSTALRGFEAGDPHVARTSRGSIQARHVILATHVPVLDRTLAFAKLVQRRHFAVAGEVDRDVRTTVDVSGRRFSTRPLRGDGEARRAIVVGSAITTGHGSGTESMHGVLAWAETHLGLRLTHTWASQDADPVDELPLVGAVLGTPRLSIATGFAGWGFAAGTAGAIDLVRRIADEPLRAPSWKPDRLGLLRGLGTVASVVGWTARGIVADAIALPQRDLLETAAGLSPGQGAVIRDGARPLAVSVDRDGTVRIVHGRCTHLGCVVRWDAESAAWACPCHGSRFATDGGVLHGPATAALRPFDPEAPGSGARGNVQHDGDAH